MRRLCLLLPLSVWLLAACTEFQPLLSALTPAPSPQTALPPTPTVPVVPSPTSPPITPGPVTLRLWVPPQFDPNSGSPAADLLSQRLSEFARQHPGIQLEVRVKAISGPGGLLDSLASASAAAPQVMPDVVALPRELMEEAAIKGLLHIFPDTADIQNGPDWYGYARQLAQLQNSVYGLPFAGEVGLLVYRLEDELEPPADWSAVLESNTPLIFAAGQPDAIFTLALYQARGGALQDDQGHPVLDAARLEEVLKFYGDARTLGVMPDWLAQLEEDEETWASFSSGSADTILTWSERYLSMPGPELAVAPLPTPEGVPFTLARGWVWALASPDADRQELGKELALFLFEDGFVSSWVKASGYLPTRPSILTAWEDFPFHLILDAISHSARLQPSEDILAILGAPVKQAVVSVLTGSSEPASAALIAVDSIQSP